LYLFFSSGSILTFAQPSVRYNWFTYAYTSVPFGNIITYFSGTWYVPSYPYYYMGGNLYPVFVLALTDGYYGAQLQSGLSWGYWWDQSAWNIYNAVDSSSSSVVIVTPGTFINASITYKTDKSYDMNINGKITNYKPTSTSGAYWAYVWFGYWPNQYWPTTVDKACMILPTDNQLSFENLKIIVNWNQTYLPEWQVANYSPQCLSSTVVNRPDKVTVTWDYLYVRPPNPEPSKTVDPKLIWIPIVSVVGFCCFCCIIYAMYKCCDDTPSRTNYTPLPTYTPPVRRYCNQCNGEGRKSNSCTGCDGVGYLKATYVVETRQQLAGGSVSLPCPTCNGRGSTSVTCWKCNGSGNE